MNIILIGPPGSGKSTQGALLSQALSLPYFSVGSILRSLAEGDSQQAQTIRSYINEGNLLPDHIIMPILDAHLAHEDHKNGFILDGFPRDVEQAKAFTQHIDVVVYIRLPDKESLWRIAKRTDKRHDQSAATILHRIEVFHEQTDKVIEYYASQGILKEIDGMPDPQTIHTSILQALKA